MYFIFAGELTDNIKNMRLLHQGEHNPPPPAPYPINTTTTTMV